VHEASEALGAATGAVYRWDEAEGLQPLGEASTTDQTDKPDHAFEELAVGQAITRRAPVLLQNPRPDEEPNLPSPAVRAVLAVPLLHEGRVLGGMHVTASEMNRRFNSDDMEVLEVLAASASSTLVGLERTQLLQRMAETDALTGLMNRHRASTLIQQF